MHSLFSYDSKFGQVMSFIGDLLITNILFILCCIPIVTIGAAQAGLHTAMRRKEDATDDRSCVKAFFEGFKSGFLKITLVSTVFLILEAVAYFTMMMALEFQESGALVHWAVPAVALGVLMLIHGLITPFHSRFNCTPINLIRNSMLLLATHPLRSIAVSVLTWIPAIVYALDWSWFARLGGLFFAVYYSIAFLFATVLLKKPFKLLTEDMEAAEAVAE